MNDNSPEFNKCRELVEFLAEIKKNREDGISKREVGIGEFLLDEKCGILITCNLGSCVGLSLFDRVTKIGALLHVKLPEDVKFDHVSYQPVRREKLSAYADTALPIVLHEFERRGIGLSRLEAKLAGGARMFPVEDPKMDIGRANIETIKRLLGRYQIKIAGEDTGDTYGRTMELELFTGEARIYSPGKEMKIL
jgi:chemotaxis protein CheD